MVKPNYAFARRQREMAKKQKQEEKRRRKAGTPDVQTADTETAPQPAVPKHEVAGG